MDNPMTIIKNLNKTPIETISSFKLSRYIVVSPSFMDNQYRVIYSTRTTKMQLVQAEYVKWLRLGRFTKIPSKVLKVLKESEILVPKEANELDWATNRFKKNVDSQNSLSFVVQPSANCQLGCTYCGQKHTNDTLNPFLTFQILERFRSMIHSQKFKAVSVGWFGGEAMMALGKMEFLSEEFIKICDEQGVAYQGVVVTNGVLLKLSNFKRLVDKKITKFEITIDGLKEHHDKTRMFKNGKGSYDIIIKNLLAVCEYIKQEKLEKAIHISLRYNVTAENYTGVKTFIDFLVKHKIDQVATFYIAPIHSWGNEAHLQGLGSERFAQFEIEILRYLENTGFNTAYVPHKLVNTTCVAVNKDDIVIDAYGNVHKCSETPYVPGYGLGEEQKDDLVDFVSEFDETFKNWYDIINNKEVPCGGCNILPLCGGKCPKIWAENLEACPPIKKNIEERVLLAFKQQLHRIASNEIANIN